MRRRVSVAHAAAQTLTEKSGAIALLIPGHKAELVFKKSTSFRVLLDLEELERGGFISLNDARPAISLVLNNRDWADDSSQARTFTISSTPTFSFEIFREALPLGLFERIVDLG